MAQAIPPIYAPPPRPIRLTLPARLVALLLSLLFLAPLAVGAWLTPDPSGVGTHRQLGWAPCGTLVASGVPCPSCGMTTSVALFAHFDWGGSFYAQPAAFLLSLLLAWSLVLCLYIAITARPIHRLLPIAWFKWLVLGAAVAVLAGWGWTVYLHAHLRPVL